MAIEITVTRRRLDRDYFNKDSLSDNSYGGSISGSSTATIQIHREFATLLGDAEITDKNVEITFGKSFIGEPNGWFEVYRMVSQSGGYTKQPVLCTHDNEEWLTNEGFQLRIAAHEDLTGVILKYNYTE